MTWLRRLGWITLIGATVIVAVAVYVVRLPDPTDALVIDHASYFRDGAQGKDVALPHMAFSMFAEPPDEARYTAHFDLATVPSQPLFLFIPLANRAAVLKLNGETLLEGASRTVWSGLLVSNPMMVMLPRRLLVAGRNDVTLELDVGETAIPIYVSRLFVGSEAALSPYYRLRLFVEDRLKTMALAAHLLLGFGVIIAFFYRPKDPLFAWLSAMVGVSFTLTSAMFVGFQPHAENLLSYVAAVSPAVGLLAVGFSYALIGLTAPSWVAVMAVAVPAVSALAIWSDLWPGRFVLVLIDVAILLAAFAVALFVVASGAFRRGSLDARLMLPAFFLAGWFLIRDALVTAQLIDRPLIMITPYVRPFFLVAVMAVLMRRLALSLDHLDRANENLNRRLAEREAELAELHREEGLEAARQIRDQERQRLTHDLHDGISGHLVSIIAMSERAGGDVKPIEQTARQALDDLRLVIYSLDLGDRELPLALANYRERLIPQLRRIGVELVWSTANLPEVSGVTPGNALTILRILQEAITNALKHGPARQIAIRGAAAANGMVAITVENDGRPFVAGNAGFGLPNMRRRARALQGDVEVMSTNGGVVLTLLLPLCLPDFPIETRSAVNPVTD